MTFTITLLLLTSFFLLVRFIDFNIPLSYFGDCDFFYYYDFLYEFLLDYDIYVFSILGMTFLLKTIFSYKDIIQSKKRKNKFKKIKKASDLSKIDWREFEYLSAEYFKKKGFNTTVVGGSGGDGGIDLIIKKWFRTYLVQCKHWKRKIPVEVVREQYGVMIDQKADGVFIIATSGFTADAKAFIKKKKIYLLDGEKFVNKLNSR